MGIGGGKSQASQRPTALGTMLQASTYGATIPSIYGCARSPLLVVWAANLRQGSSDKKGKKKQKKKKSPPTYVENIDFLIGSNPIAGLLQFWENQNQVYPLNFLKFRGAPAGSGPILDPGWLELTIPDAEFYFVCAVTAEVTLSGSFNDYGGSGAVSYGGVYELPLWNGIQQGPDISDPNHNRFPYYLWQPSQGATIAIPNPPLIDRFMTAGAWNGFVNVYYAQLSALIHRHSPATALRLTFESSLGNNAAVYAPAPSQRITYPQYAGAGSPDLDLGTTAMIPNLRPEVMGSYTFIPPRDAEFADMIEDVIRSGVLQVGSELGYIQRGVNCNDLPGPVQSNFSQFLEPNNPVVPFLQPNNAGSVLMAACRFRPGAGGTPPTVADDAGNIWTLLYSDDQRGIWYSSPCVAAPAGNKVKFTYHGGGFAYNADAYILEMDPGFTVVDATSVVHSTTAGPLTPSLTTTGTPDFIIAVSFSDSGSEVLPAHWKNLFPAAIPSWSLVCGRKVAAPGTYSFSQTVLAGNERMIALIALKSSQPAPYPKALGNILDYDSLYQVRMQCRAGGLQGSVSLDAQKTAADWLKDFYACANAAPVWSGFALKSIPRSEASAVGGGAVYISPTASGPVATLTENDLIGDSSKPLITVERKAQVDANNILQVQCYDRQNMYNQSTVSQPESGAIALFGPRKESPIVLQEIMDPLVARKILAIEVRRRVYLRNIYMFTAKAKWIGLEAMDLVLINDSQIGLTNFPVRLTSIKENENLELECEAEPFIYGLHAPNDLTVTAPAPYVPSTGVTPASVNAPIFLEPVPRLISSSPGSVATSQQQLWVVVSDPDASYGGCVVMMSTDGGSSYIAMGSIVGNAITGYTVGDWPAAADPDTTNDLLLDLTESNGVLSSFQVADEDAFTYPCYVDGGAGEIPYELMTYAVATLTSLSHYTLKATGGGTNKLRRAVFGAPTASQGVDHPNNSRWAFLNPAGTGLFKINLDPHWIGKTLHFKFLAYNNFAQGLQDLSAATDYTYTPTGVGQSANPNANAYTISGGALTNPTSTTIHMAQATAQFPSNQANYNARTLTIPAPGVPTMYYVTIHDPSYLGDTGSGTTLTAYAETTQAKVGQAGYVYIGSIQALPAGGGTVAGPGGWPPAEQIFVNGV